MPEIKATDPYGCHNRLSYEDSVVMQDGYARPVGFEGNQTRLPKMAIVPFRMSKDCQYDKSGTDPRCAGCGWHNPENAAKYGEKSDGNAALTLLGTTAEEYAEFKKWRDARRK